MLLGVLFWYPFFLSVESIDSVDDIDYRRYRKNVENVEIVDNSSSLDKYDFFSPCFARLILSLS